MRPPPRLFGIPARDAPVVAVLRRCPSDWAHVGRWDVDAPTFRGGTWLHGTLYPQRCDLSPDGRYLCYFTLASHARWSAGWTYIAVSRLPWLTAMAAWGTDGTWTRGLHGTNGGGGEAAFRGGPAGRWQPPLYVLGDDVLTDVQWADWASDDGRGNTVVTRSSPDRSADAPDVTGWVG